MATTEVSKKDIIWLVKFILILNLEFTQQSFEIP